MRDRRPLAIRPASFKLGLVIVIEALVESGKGAVGQGSERLSGARHQGIAPGGAMVLERAAQQRGSRLQDRPAPRGLDELGLGISALLQRRFSADAALERTALFLNPVAFGVTILFLLPKVFVLALE